MFFFTKWSIFFIKIPANEYTDRKNCRNSTQHSKKKPRNAPFPDIKSKNTLIIK